MSKAPMPAQGGRYIRSKDGELKRIDSAPLHGSASVPPDESPSHLSKGGVGDADGGLPSAPVTIAKKGN
ncbi:MAG: hypothetical protein LBI35_07230 [Burkholderiales bacterium]|jgi:hypothetical protein|nr:hypothetical protein [Burkholderiales bacterium]